MKDGYKIVPYDDSLVSAHQKFAATMWPSKRRRREECYVRWKFHGPSTGPVENLLLVVKDQEVVGQLGHIPVTLMMEQAAHSAQWICDLMVLPEHRGGGLGSGLIRASVKLKPVTLGSNPSPSAGPVIDRLGFGKLAGPSMMILPLQLSHIVSWKMPERYRFLTKPLGTIGTPYMAWRMRALSRGHLRNSVKRVHWREVVPLVQERQQRLMEPYILHDEAFLSWRCPGLEGFNKELPALITDQGGYALVEPHPRDFYVHEWYAPDEASCLALFQEILVMGQEWKCLAIRVLAQNVQEIQWLDRMGLLRMRHPTEVVIYPNQVLDSNLNYFHYCLYDSDGNL